MILSSFDINELESGIYITDVFIKYKGKKKKKKKYTRRKIHVLSHFKKMDHLIQKNYNP